MLKIGKRFNLRKKKGWLFVLILVCLTTNLALGQSAPAKAEAGLEAAGKELLSTYKGLFENSWSKKFAELWNKNRDTAKVLAGLGRVWFVRADTETAALLVNFDSSGRAEPLKVTNVLPKDSFPAFQAVLTNWANFMEGKFGAVGGVMTGKIKFTGNFSVALKYGQAFDKVAPVGKRASLAILKKGRKN